MAMGCESRPEHELEMRTLSHTRRAVSLTQPYGPGTVGRTLLIVRDCWTRISLTAGNTFPLVQPQTRTHVTRLQVPLVATATESTL